MALNELPDLRVLRHRCPPGAGGCLHSYHSRVRVRALTFRGGSVDIRPRDPRSVMGAWRPGAGRVLAQRLPEHGAEGGRLSRRPGACRALEVARNPADEVDAGLRRPDQRLRHQVRRVDIDVQSGWGIHHGFLLILTHSPYPLLMEPPIGPKPNTRRDDKLLPCGRSSMNGSERRKHRDGGGKS